MFIFVVIVGITDKIVIKKECLIKLCEDILTCAKKSHIINIEVFVMLKRFNVKNFMSFLCRDDGLSHEFSMIPGKVRNKEEHVYTENDIRLLKFAGIYGANAAGKSNLISALKCMREIILNGGAEGYTEKYCRINFENKDIPSYFEVEIVIDNKCYAYGFEVILSRAAFVSEWLFELHSDGKDVLIFERDIKEKRYKFKSWKERGLAAKMDVYAWDIEGDNTALLLSVINDNKKNLYDTFQEVKIFRDVYLWFERVLSITFPLNTVSGYSYMSNSGKINDICRLISDFGTGITNISTEDIAYEKLCEILPNDFAQKLKIDIEKSLLSIRNNEKTAEYVFTIRNRDDIFVISIDNKTNIRVTAFRFSHGSEDILFKLSEESDGTVRLLELLDILLSSENHVFVIDELDRCLHPCLTYKFIEMFFKTSVNKNIQLIVTTHESRLMNFDLLRRDEIWFVDKRDSGLSDIYSLEEYNERFDKKIDKAYLEGRYGGIPVFSSGFQIGEV